MNPKSWYPLTSMLITLGLIFAFQNPTAPRQAHEGDNAAGEVIQQLSNSENVMLNTTPCSSTQTRIIFHSPYRIVRKDKAACQSSMTGAYREYERIQIEQR
jgi:hypothetical protein